MSGERAIDQRVKHVKESDYVLKEYDFTNTVITIDGVDYKYKTAPLMNTKIISLQPSTWL